ncbi:MAG: adenylate/guanylate cyclase domain-containing response regulator [Chloroflexi bacterium]|nr:MAG: adenylate/guanylate cyclase domain-containing response regulator [Chloroflexota bacterium]
MKKILAVDDNPDNIQLIVDIVEDLGHDVIKAYDGYQALDAVKQFLPDLILLDVNMPGMSGFEVLAKLKENDETKQIPVIMLTALAGIDHRVEGLGLGAEDYLVKPFSPLELIARIKARLRAKAQTDDLREMQQVIRKTFERYVSSAVVNQLLKDPTSIELGGKLQMITVFFADIEGFTTTSERTDPETILTVLNKYHEVTVQIVQQEGGTIDKFIGDAVMALFNTPLQQPDHPLRAVRAACRIRDSLPQFHEQFSEEFRLKINFGIHTGWAVVGNVGAPQIMDFTAVGDTVNVAARLQDLSHNGQILISDATYQLIHQAIRAHPIGAKIFKGRSEAVMTYEVLAILND